MSGVQRSAKISRGDGDRTELTVALHAPDCRHAPATRQVHFLVLAAHWRRAIVGPGSRGPRNGRRINMTIASTAPTADRCGPTGPVSPASWRRASPPAPPAHDADDTFRGRQLRRAPRAPAVFRRRPRRAGRRRRVARRDVRRAPHARAWLQLDGAGAVDAHAPGSHPRLALASRASARRAAAAPHRRRGADPRHQRRLGLAVRLGPRRRRGGRLSRHRVTRSSPAARRPPTCS